MKKQDVRLFNQLLMFPMSNLWLLGSENLIPFLTACPILLNFLCDVTKSRKKEYINAQMKLDYFWHIWSTHAAKIRCL